MKLRVSLWKSRIITNSAALLLWFYRNIQTWSDWIDIKVEDICDKDKTNVIVLKQDTDSEKSIDKTQVSNIQVIARDWYESSSSFSL